MFTRLNNCLCCLSKDLETVLDLGMQPLANDFKDNDIKDDFKNNGSSTGFTKYELKLNYCRGCFHCQLSIALDPSVLFKNYMYVSGTSSTGRKHFEDVAKLCETNRHKSFEPAPRIKVNDKIESKIVLDIACNDGSQLDCFKKLGYNTFGVDPAENLFKDTSTKHIIVCDFWNTRSCTQLQTLLKGKTCDVIVAQNVFAHTKYTDEFLDCCTKVLAPNGLLYIQTSQCKMINRGEFDTIYHEHLSFFNVQSMARLLGRHNLSLLDVVFPEIHGSSYLFVINKSSASGLTNGLAIKSIIENEKELHLSSTYTIFRNKSENTINTLRVLGDLVAWTGIPCIGFGAAAKGMTVLNASNLKLAYIVDENPLKINKLSNCGIPIRPIKHLSMYAGQDIAVFVLAWNFLDEITLKLKSAKVMFGIKSIRVVTYFPVINSFLV